MGNEKSKQAEKSDGAEEAEQAGKSDDTAIVEQAGKSDDTKKAEQAGKYDDTVTIEQTSKVDDTAKAKQLGKVDSTAKVEQASAQSKDAVPHHRINVQMVQNVFLIWLDKHIDDNNADCLNTIAQLQCVVNTIKIFTDGDQCIQFLEDMDNKKVCILISGAFGQRIVPRIHNMSQVDSIFIFCGNKEYHEQWAKDYSKIKGVFTNIEPICVALKQAAQQGNQNVIPISFVAISGSPSKKNLDELEPSFMYTQTLKEILLTIDFEEKHIKEFIDYCRDVLVDNQAHLENMEKLEREYRDETPIWWYTFECFLDPMLNRALKLMDIDIIIKMGFFIVDLHRHIERLHSEQFGSGNSSNSFTVYHGEGMIKEDFEKMTKTKGGLISFNTFLSTTRERNVSINFANHAARNPDLIGILFVMTIDPSQSTTPFASITDVSYFKEEDEVLFSMHAVFRINDITPMMDENHHLFQVELTLTSDNDKDLSVLTNHIREETFSDEERWYRLGLVLLKMGQPEKAQEVYETLLDQVTENSEKAHIYHQLGWAKYNQGKYEEAIPFCEESLQIYKKILPPNHPYLRASYNNIGNVYYNMGEYSNALSSYEKALQIQQQSLSPNHSDFGMSYNNIGIVYDNVGEYSKALSSHEKALEIRKESLPPDHHNLASSYNNIGIVYRNMKRYTEALSYYEKALEIQQHSLPPNHPDLAGSYNNIGIVYRNMGAYSKALLSHEKALEIQKQSLPPNHRDLGMSYNNIGLVYEDRHDYSTAHSFYERAVEVGEHSLPSNHPRLQKWRNNLDSV